MLLSRACEYAIRAGLHLAMAPAGVTIKSASEALGLPYPFLAKIVQTLVRNGIVSATRGAKGGIVLARPASSIMLRDFVVAIDGPAVFTECVLGLPGCGERKPCPLHEEWASTRARIESTFGGTTLAQLAGRMREGDYRLGG